MAFGSGANSFRLHILAKLYPQKEILKIAFSFQKINCFLNPLSFTFFPYNFLRVNWPEKEVIFLCKTHIFFACTILFGSLLEHTLLKSVRSKFVLIGMKFHSQRTLLKKVWTETAHLLLLFLSTLLGFKSILCRKTWTFHFFDYAECSI